MDQITPACHHQGVPINNIIFVITTFNLYSDACEYGIGGYNHSGLSRQFRIPPQWHGKLTLNLLELLASAISIYMTIQQLGHVSHILAFTDSSSALGWMHKASFDPLNAESHNAVARWIGWTLISNETSLY